MMNLRHLLDGSSLSVAQRIHFNVSGRTYGVVLVVLNFFLFYLVLEITYLKFLESLILVQTADSYECDLTM